MDRSELRRKMLTGGVFKASPKQAPAAPVLQEPIRPVQPQAAKPPVSAAPVSRPDHPVATRIVKQGRTFSAGGDGKLEVEKTTIVVPKVPGQSGPVEQPPVPSGEDVEMHLDTFFSVPQAPVKEQQPPQPQSAGSGGLAAPGPLDTAPPEQFVSQPVPAIIRSPEPAQQQQAPSGEGVIYNNNIISTDTGNFFKRPDEYLNPDEQMTTHDMAKILCVRGLVLDSSVHGATTPVWYGGTYSIVYLTQEGKDKRRFKLDTPHTLTDGSSYPITVTKGKRTVVDKPDLPFTLQISWDTDEVKVEITNRSRKDVKPHKPPFGVWKGIKRHPMELTLGATAIGYMAAVNLIPGAQQVLSTADQYWKYALTIGYPVVQAAIATWMFVSNSHKKTEIKR
jgi:hypothetical protein